MITSEILNYLIGAGVITLFIAPSVIILSASMLSSRISHSGEKIS